MDDKKPITPKAMDDNPLPDLVNWSQIVEAPTTLKELSIEDGNALTAATAATTGLGDLAYEDLVSTLLIAAGAVTNAKIAVDAIQGAVIAAGAITETKVASDAISTPKLQAGSITTAKIAAGAVTATEIAALTIVAGNIASDAIVSAKIAAGAITAIKIAAATITGDKIAAGTITASNIAASTITASQIAAGTITATQIASSTITATQIAASTITASKLNISQLSAVTADMGTITAGKFQVSTRITIEKSDGTDVGHLGQDPGATGIWGFIAERGYGLMCRYTSNNYFRIYMDSGSTDAVIDMPSPDKIKIQDNGGNAIARFYGRSAGFTSLGGLDMFGPIRLYTSSSTPSGTGLSDGMIFYNSFYDEVWVYKAGAWKALAYVP